MKKYLIVLAVGILGCSPAREVVQVLQGVPGQDGSSCSVSDYYGESEVKLGALISCTDGSSSLILNGERGATGVQGVAGEDGRSCSVSRSRHSDYATISCPGSQSVRVYDGEDGRDGRNGVGCSVRTVSGGAQVTCGHGVAFISNGFNGTNGTSCSVTRESGRAKITCGSSFAYVNDGEDGADSALANALGIADILKPCGDEFPNDEVFMKLTDGRVLAVYDGGPQEDRLTIVVPGMQYITTDRNRNRTCHFTINAAGNFSSQYVD